MNDPAPFRLSLPQARRLKAAVVVCAGLALLAMAGSFAYAVVMNDMRQLANATLASAVLLALLGLGLYVRRALGLAHQRQVWTLAQLTDPNAPELPASEPETPRTEIPSPRPAVEPESSRDVSS